MNKADVKFCEQYGDWALISGAADGLGAEYARQIAKRNINLVFIDLQTENLMKIKQEWQETFHIHVIDIGVDLSADNMMSTIISATKDLEINLLVNVASQSNIGNFLDFDLKTQQNVILVNCTAMMMLVHHFGSLMRKRKKGGIILMSSFSSLQGAPFVAHYAATKAYTVVLAESLWYELKPENVHVLGVIAGQLDTPKSASRNPDYKKYKPPIQQVSAVVKEALNRLGKTPSLISGFKNKFNAFFFTNLFSKEKRIQMTGESIKKMYLQRSE